MTATRKIEFEVSDRVAEYLDRQMADGGFADEGAVVLSALEQAATKAEDERWLREAVVPVAARVQRDGSAGLTAEEVFGGARDRYLARRG